jgi:hypothetical protein
MDKLKTQKKKTQDYIPQSETTEGGKYIKKVIKMRSPYLEKNQVITKKYLNPKYQERDNFPSINPSKSDYITLNDYYKPGSSMSSANRSVSPRNERSANFEEAPSKLGRSLSPSRKDIYNQSLFVSNASNVSTSPSTTNKSQLPQQKQPTTRPQTKNVTSPSNRLYKSTSKFVIYFFDCTMGNNGILMKRLLNNRRWWRDCKDTLRWKPEPNFVWTQNAHWYNYEKLTTEGAGEDRDKYRCINRLKDGYEINDKDNLYRNLWHHLKGDPNAVCSIVPCTFSFRAEEANLDRQLQLFARFFKSLQNKIPLDQVKPLRTKVDAQGSEYEVYFEFKNSYEPGEVTKKFCNFKAEEIPKHETVFGDQNIWMIKPSGLNRGKGLELFTSLQELNDFIKIFSEGYDVVEFANMDYSDADNISPTKKAMQDKEEGKKRTTPKVYANSDFNIRIKNFVIQKYIEKPLLYKGYKFDLRVFVLFTHQRELLVFEDAYVRLSSLPYDPQKKNYLIHLTNNAVQVRSNSYGSIIKGNIMSISELEKEVIKNQRNNSGEDANKGDKPKVTEGYFMEKIREIVKTTFDSTNQIIEKKKREFTFELFGYDFMIDEQLKVWLIEVNSNPSLGESNKYLSKFMARALDDMLKLTLDQIFPRPPDTMENTAVQELPPFDNNRNLWRSVAKY